MDNRIARPPSARGMMKRSTPFLGVAFLVWMFSGNPTITSTSNYVLFQIIGFVIEFAICFSLLRYFDRLRPFVVISVLYVTWFLLSAISGISDQVLGLLGQLLKIGMVALLFAAAPKPIEALIESMRIICKIALAIFAVRYVLLLVGIDLADYFTFMYPLTGATEERSIFIFNFHTLEDTYRNSGPFREPGLFAANLVIVFILLLSPWVEYTQAERMRRILLFGAALLTTSSTMGLVATIPLGVLILRRLPVGALKKYVLLGTAVAAVAAVFMMSDSSHIEKITRQIQLTEMQSNTWYQTRFGNAYVDYIAAMAKPFVGYGFAESGRPILWDTRVQMQYIGEGNLGFGNGFSGTFVKFGVPFALILYLYFASRVFALAGEKFAGAMSVIAFFIILFSQQLLLLPAIYALCIGDGQRKQAKDRKHAAPSALRARRRLQKVAERPA